jgi:hypothetical protein
MKVMIRRACLASLLPGIALVLAASPAAAVEHRLGAGVHYWKTLAELEDDGFNLTDEEGFSFILSYQFVPVRLLKLEVDFEYFPEGFGGSASGEDALSPQVYVLLGGKLYAGAGVGVVYSDGYSTGDNPTDPFYALRVGVDIPLLPRRARLDLNANYQFDQWNQYEQADTDTITLGGMIRAVF